MPNKSVISPLSKFWYGLLRKKKGEIQSGTIFFLREKFKTWSELPSFTVSEAQLGGGGKGGSPPPKWPGGGATPPPWFWQFPTQGEAPPIQESNFAD